MNWPFKFFDKFSWTGRSNTKEIKQKASHNTAPVQQAAGDIHNYPKNTTKVAPLLFIQGLGWGSNQEGVSLRPEFLNDSDEVLFIESLEVLGNDQPFPITIRSKQSTQTNLPSRPFPRSTDKNKIKLFYKDAKNKRYCTLHTVTFQKRDEGSFNFDLIKFVPPVKTLK